MPLRVGYLASGAASSAQGVYGAACEGILDVASAVLIGNNSKSGALDWAHGAGVPAYHLSGKTHPDTDALDAAIRDALLEHDSELVVLSGYAKQIGQLTLSAFEGRILNVHPAPLPRFGGRGMYGMAVHEAVLSAGERESVVTIHHVNDQYDDGEVVATYAVPVDPEDTPESLRQRVHDAEPGCWIELLGRLTGGQRLPGLEL